MILWRVSEHASLDGVGGLIVAGRWHGRGRSIVYTAEASALAMLEALVHLEVVALPPTFQLIAIEAPDLPFAEWPPDADARDERAARAWGHAWLAQGAFAVARVPSVVAPGGWNRLINPVHPDARALRVVETRRWPWDERLRR